MITLFALYKVRKAMISMLGMLSEARRFITSSDSVDFLDVEILAMKARIEELDSRVKGA